MGNHRRWRALPDSWDCLRLRERLERDERAGLIAAPERPAQDALTRRQRAHREELKALRDPRRRGAPL